MKSSTPRVSFSVGSLISTLNLGSSLAFDSGSVSFGSVLVSAPLGVGFFSSSGSGGSAGLSTTPCELRSFHLPGRHTSDSVDRSALESNLLWLKAET